MAMISPAQVAGFAFGAALCAGISIGATEYANAGATTTFARVAIYQPPPRQYATESPGRAYLFRGALGPIFSLGMDRLNDRINRAGVSSNVYEFTICRQVAETVIREYRADPAPITLIGHSMGGFCALKIAEILEVENIPVSLIVTVDPAHVTPNVPLNVERFINIFLSKDVLGGGDVTPLPGYQGHYASFDLTRRDEISHISIDKMDAVHEQLVTKIVQLVATPVKAEGEAVPLRYVVPPGVAIDLWDSGIAVNARAGDTLEAISAFYRVPLWALIQINRTADSGLLAPGQRIIVPRHLVPFSRVSVQPPARR
jgi:pimeloyl-ACP methyl ester carboxylesterase